MPHSTYQSFEDSVRISVDPDRNDVQAVSIRYSSDSDSSSDSEETVDMEPTVIFSNLVNNILEDMKKMGQLHAGLQELNEQIKAVDDVVDMKDLRARLNHDLQGLISLAKQINKKFDGLIANNAEQRSCATTSSDDQTRFSMISDLTENLKHMMRDFQGLRLQMESEHRQLIEHRYFAITHERATAEAISNLIMQEMESGSTLHCAIDTQGGAAVAEAVEEIQVQRETMKEVRKNLMSLHQIFLGITTPVEGSEGLNRGAVAIGGGGMSTPGKSGTGGGGLNDYEKGVRNRAYRAIAIALVIIFVIILLLLKVEHKVEPSD